jgi:hypothetical protein
VQQDRFTFNWRKTASGDQYPRYPYVRQKFLAELDVFREFLAREKLGELSVNQWEVTYVNEILPSAGWERHGQLGEVVTTWVTRYSDSFLPGPEGIGLHVSYVIPDSEGGSLGRLHIRVDSAYQAIGKPVFLMTLTARGRLAGEEAGAVERCLDLGREWVVRGFTSITSPRMHDVWERRDEPEPAR